MIPKGQTVTGDVALRKKIHDLLSHNTYRSYRVAEIADKVGSPAKRVSATLLAMMNDEKVAMNYPHIHRIDRGVFIYDSQRPQVFTKRPKRVKTIKTTSSQTTVQPMSVDFTEVKEAIVLRHKSGKLYVARPVS